MRFALTAGLVASAWLVQQAVSTSWGDSPSFSSVSNTNNTCSADQQSGFDWSGLPTGSFSSFGGFGFGGFSCQDSFQPNARKRSLKTRDDFQVSQRIPSCTRTLIDVLAVKVHSRQSWPVIEQWPQLLLFPRRPVLDITHASFGLSRHRAGLHLRYA